MLIIIASPNSILTNGSPSQDVVDVLKDVKSQGHPVGLVSNKSQPSWFQGCFDGSRVQFLNSPGRQNGKIVSKNAKKFQLEPYNVLVLASKPEDVQMGKNGGAVLVAAAWSNLPSEVEALGIKAQSAAEFRQIIDLTDGWPGGWWSSFDGSNYRVRALADLSTFGKGHTQAQFRDGVKATVKSGGVQLNSLLTVVARSLLSEGLADKKNLFWGVYPSSTSSNKDDEVLSDFTHRLRTTVSKVRMAYRGKPLFIRHTPSIRRHTVSGSIDRTDPVNQIKTIHLNPHYRGKLQRRNVIVIDDCTTYGVSFGVAAAFLKAAGAASVTCVALGKFGDQLREYDISIKSDPFAPVTADENFSINKVSRSYPKTNPVSQSVLQKLIG